MDLRNWSDHITRNLYTRIIDNLCLDVRGFVLFLFLNKKPHLCCHSGCSNVLPRTSNLLQALTILRITFSWEISYKFKIRICQKENLLCQLSYRKRRANKNKVKFNIVNFWDSLGKSKVLQFGRKFTSLRAFRGNTCFDKTFFAVNSYNNFD